MTATPKSSASRTSECDDVKADTTQLGSYSVDSCTPRWAWSNPPVGESERNKSAKLKALYDRTGMDFFRNENFRPGMPHNVAADRAVVAVLVIRAVVGAPAGC